MAYISFTPMFLFNLHNITCYWENCDLDDSIIFPKSQNLKAAKSDFQSGLLAASPPFHQRWFHFPPRTASDSTSISSSPPPMGRTQQPPVTEGQDQYLRRQVLAGLESGDEKLARAALTVHWGEELWWELHTSPHSGAGLGKFCESQVDGRESQEKLTSWQAVLSPSRQMLEMLGEEAGKVGGHRPPPADPIAFALGFMTGKATVRSPRSPQQSPGKKHPVAGICVAVVPRDHQCLINAALVQWDIWQPLAFYCPNFNSGDDRYEKWRNKVRKSCKSWPEPASQPEAGTPTRNVSWGWGRSEREALSWIEKLKFYIGQEVGVLLWTKSWCSLEKVRDRWQRSMERQEEKQAEPFSPFTNPNLSVKRTLLLPTF